MSTTSFMDEVEMAQDEVFAGPMGESVPTSVSSFAHRRGRADSTTSFAFYQEDDDEPIQASDESAIVDEEEYDFQDQFEDDGSVDLEAGEHAPLRRTSTSQSREPSVHDRLLRSDSAKTDVSVFGKNRNSQKIYVVTEDLTIVVAGFQTSAIGNAFYITLCVFTFGLAYLLLRWFPKWQVQLTGSPCPLRKCSWVVVEVSNIPTSNAFQHLIAQEPLLTYDRINGENWSYKMWK